MAFIAILAVHSIPSLNFLLNSGFSDANSQISRPCMSLLECDPTFSHALAQIVFHGATSHGCVSISTIAARLVSLPRRSHLEEWVRPYSVSPSPPSDAVKILRRTRSRITRARQLTSGEGASERVAASWDKVIGPPWRCMMSGIPNSTADFKAMESAKLNMYFHISAWPCMGQDFAGGPTSIKKLDSVVQIYTGIKMHRKIFAYVYYDGEIKNVTEGVIFTCRRPKGISLEENMTLGSLKTLINEKLNLSENQTVSEIIYRMPLNMNPLRYGQLHVGEDSDFQFVIERHLQICSEFGLMEFYVEISTHDIDIDIENQLSSDYNTQPTPQTDQTLIASSSRLQIVGTCQPPTEDLGEFSDEDEYEASDLTAVRTFSWGSAVLAYLYRELCNATDPNTNDISGCMVLLHLWAWDRFPGLAPHQPHFIDPQLNVFGDLPPLGYRWTCIDVHYHQRYDTLKKYRLLLDSLKEDQVLKTVNKIRLGDSPRNAQSLCHGEPRARPDPGAHLELPLSTDDSVLTELSKVWENTIVVKLLGKEIGYNFLFDRLAKMWNPKGRMDMIDLGFGFFQIQFEQEEDL
ncbi:serine/threonine-protein phosphatase 7 long form-like protein [Senna tora]|uniref:Serine/threonine-protein phosphatase 7 long form-like protein n=1 Tax=Senna tora TaxID=362788 RepID=A0A834WJT5_9FABA|nr:serine/threonine-protein phosphatase 7 long form-like protein [Senna tora]